VVLHGLVRPDHLAELLALADVVDGDVDEVLRDADALRRGAERAAVARVGDDLRALVAAREQRRLARRPGDRGDAP
jgi:hypothetical protein